jgi:predicted nucleic acid-binding protein
MDTSAYFALADPDERTHQTARAISRRLIGERWRLFTTNFVLAETHALLLRRLGRTMALRVLLDIDHSTTTIVRVGTADEHRAREILARYTDKDFSLTDATSFAVMERLDIVAAFSFDRDFTQYGFTALQPT